MKNNDASLSVLLAELEADLEALKGLEASNFRAMARLDAGADEDLDYAALGYTLHNIYNLMENAFYRVAKHFENNLSGDSWHKDLIRRMTLTIEGIRPAVLDQSTADLLDDLRSFRHVFRNMYRKNLDEKKLLALQADVPASLEGFRKNLTHFIGFLRTAQQ